MQNSKTEYLHTYLSMHHTFKCAHQQEFNSEELQYCTNP